MRCIVSYFLVALSTATLAIAGGRQNQLAGGPRPQFEVASIRVNRTGSTASNGLKLPGGGFRGTNMSLRDLIRGAYRLERFQIVGGPQWIDSSKFDIVAKPEMPATSEQVDLMLQVLLEERFKLKFHYEQRDGSLFALVVHKGGHQLLPTRYASCIDHYTPDGTRCGGFNVSLRNAPGDPSGGGRLNGIYRTVAEFAMVLQSITGRTVENRTNIDGVFDFRFEWGAEVLPPAAAGDGALPGFFTALQEQMGLRLVSETGAVRAFVIEGVEPPTEN